MSDQVTTLGSGEQLTTLNADNRVPITDANGKMYWMNRDDLMKIVMELMPTVTTSAKGLMPTDGFIPRGTVTAANVDNALLPGVYTHGTAIIDGGSYGTLIVFRDSGRYIVQIDVKQGLNVSIRTLRINNDGTITIQVGWRKLTLTT